MNKILSGGCLCGITKFSITDDFKDFFQCHCKQCQQLTGSAFASNIITYPKNIEWLCGEDSVTVYEHSTREFSKCFCSICGSSLPFLNKSKTVLIVPAGSLNEPPKIQPQANIFTAEEAYWFKSGALAQCFTGFHAQNKKVQP